MWNPLKHSKRRLTQKSKIFGLAGGVLAWAIVCWISASDPVISEADRKPQALFGRSSPPAHFSGVTLKPELIRRAAPLAGLIAKLPRKTQFWNLAEEGYAPSPQHAAEIERQSERAEKAQAKYRRYSQQVDELRKVRRQRGVSGWFTNRMSDVNALFRGLTLQGSLTSKKSSWHSQAELERARLRDLKQGAWLDEGRARLEKYVYPELDAEMAELEYFPLPRESNSAGILLDLAATAESEFLESAEVIGRTYRKKSANGTIFSIQLALDYKTGTIIKEEKSNHDSAGNNPRADDPRCSSCHSPNPLRSDTTLMGDQTILRILRNEMDWLERNP